MTQVCRLFHEIQQKSRELEIASQHKSQFAANMSHELRTPLAAMLGYAELLKEGIYDALPEKSLPIRARVESNGKHLLGLINTGLDISKIEAGQFTLNLAEYALGTIVETVLVATESLAATKKLGFRTEVAKGLPYGIGDEQRLTQVLLNLVGNAIKITDAGEVRIAAGAANGHFELSVSDTGPGSPPEECDRIFEKFPSRQFEHACQGRHGPGSCHWREIVEMHGGRICVESTMGEGSTFRLEFQIAIEAKLLDVNSAKWADLMASSVCHRPHPQAPDKATWPRTCGVESQGGPIQGYPRIGVVFAGLVGKCQ